MSHHHDVAPDVMRLQNNTGIPSSKLGMWLFLASDAMGFIGLLGAYLVIRSTSETWPKATEDLNIPLVTLNTFILICSSVTMVKGLAALQDGNRKWYKIHIFLTAFLGMLFVGIQGVEWYEMMGLGQESHAVIAEAAPGHEAAEAGHAAAADHGEEAHGEEGGHGGHKVYRATESLFGATFYGLTGYHGLHVLIGVIYLFTHLFISLITEKNGETWVDSKDNTMLTEIMGLYWHFVDLVWIILFTVIYLM